MGRKRISITEYNALLQDVRDALTELATCEAAFAKAQECEVMDNCPECKGKGLVENGTGDPGHNPTGKMLYKDCPDCEGKGYR